MAEKTSPPPAWVDYATIIILGPFVMPAMWFMVYKYSTWETWIKDNGDLVKKWDRLLLIIPFTVVMLVSMIIYHLFHKTFEEAIKNRFGLKLF